MSDLLIQLSEVMRAEINGLDVIANNTANIPTPGYRSQRPMLNHKAFAGRLLDPNASPVVTTVSNRDGPLQVTGVKTDLAIRGSGWFVVETKDGFRLTRDGRFRLNDEGLLVDRSGNPVFSDGIDLLGLKPDFTVMSDGTLLSQGKPAGRLLIGRTSDASKLVPQGNGLYLYNGELSVAEGASVIQGAYETSNVDTASDMLHLMRITRHIETLQRSMSAYDQMLNTGINQLGK